MEREDIERLVGAYKGESEPVVVNLEPGPAEIAAAEAE